MWSLIGTLKKMDLVWFEDKNNETEEVVCISKNDKNTYDLIYYGFDTKDYWIKKEETLESAVFSASLKLYEEININQTKCFKEGLQKIKKMRKDFLCGKR